jgi:hypothetical protein
MPTRRLALLLPLLLPACRSRDPEIAVPGSPIGFRFLLPIRLNVAEVVVQEGEPPPPPGDFGATLAVPPARAMRQMAQERVFAVGSTGQAVFAVTQAVVLRDNTGVVCALACRLDIVGAEGGRQGFIEASARANITLPSSVSPTTRQRAGEATLRQALDKLNVEFEFQVKRNLRAWLVEAAPGASGLPAPTPGGVQREALPPA